MDCSSQHEPILPVGTVRLVVKRSGDAGDLVVYGTHDMFPTVELSGDKVSRIERSPIVATMSIGNAQQLLDSLWNLGLRPSSRNVSCSAIANMPQSRLAERAARLSSSYPMLHDVGAVEDR